MSFRQPRQDELEALRRLISIAEHDTGQSRRVANFLLAWWNADRDGGFDMRDLWHLDEAIVADIIKVFGMIGHVWAYPDSLGFDLSHLVTLWRRPKRSRRRA